MIIAATMCSFENYKTENEEPSCFVLNITSLQKNHYSQAYNSCRSLGSLVLCNNSQTKPIICRSTTDCFTNSGLIHPSSITKKDISKSTLGTYRHFSHDSSLKTLNNNKHSNNMSHSEIPDVNSRQFTAASYKDDQDSSIETRVRSANTNDGVIIDADGVEHDIVEHGNNVQYEILDEQGRTLQVQGDIQKLMQMAGSVKEVRQHDGTVVKEYILDDPRILSQLRSSLCSECPDNGNVKGCQMTSYNENHGSNTAVSSNNTSSNQTIPLNSTHIMSPQMQLTSDVPKFIYPHQHPNINEQYANQSKQSYSQNNAYTDNYRDNLQSNESSAVQRKFSHSRDARPIAMLYPPPPPPRSSLYASRLNNGQDIFDNVVLQSRRGTPLNNELSNVGIPTDHCTLSSSSNNNAHVNCNDNNRYHLSGGFNGNFGKDRFWRSRGSRSAATSPAAISMCGTSILELSPGNLYELTTSSGYVAQLTLISNRNSVIGSNQEANFNCIPTNIDLAEIALAIEQKLPPFIQAYYTKQQLQISALQHQHQPQNNNFNTNHQQFQNYIQGYLDRGYTQNSSANDNYANDRSYLKSNFNQNVSGSHLPFMMMNEQENAGNYKHVDQNDIDEVAHDNCLEVEDNYHSYAVDNYKATDGISTKNDTPMYLNDVNNANQLSSNQLNSRILLNRNNTNIDGNSAANLSYGLPKVGTQVDDITHQNLDDNDFEFLKSKGDCNETKRQQHNRISTSHDGGSSCGVIGTRQRTQSGVDRFICNKNHSSLATNQRNLIGTIDAANLNTRNSKTSDIDGVRSGGKKTCQRLTDMNEAVASNNSSNDEYSSYGGHHIINGISKLPNEVNQSQQGIRAYVDNDHSPLMAPPLLDLSSIDPQLGTYEIDENGRIIGDIPPILSEEQILFIKKQLAINGIPVDLSNIKPTNSSNNFDKNDKNQTNTNKTRSDEKGLNHSKNTNNISNNFLRRYGDVSRNNNEASLYSQNHRQLRKSKVANRSVVGGTRDYNDTRSSAINCANVQNNASAVDSFSRKSQHHYRYHQHRYSNNSPCHQYERSSPKNEVSSNFKSHYQVHMNTKLK
ncbi:hypothetical protein GJ496_010375 [Pomphorhynchus laevis]|nr:hypothetical protein GJ496_010375 [Pomphorhynchus laevis]